MLAKHSDFLKTFYVASIKHLYVPDMVIRSILCYEHILNTK